VHIASNIEGALEESGMPYGLGREQELLAEFHIPSATTVARAQLASSRKLLLFSRTLLESTKAISDLVAAFSEEYRIL
jgi:hypothetical protein